MKVQLTHRNKNGTTTPTEATTREANQIGATTTTTMVKTGGTNITGGTTKICRMTEKGAAAKTTHGNKTNGEANGKEAGKLRMIHRRRHPETHGTHKTINIRRLTETEMVVTLKHNLTRKAEAKVGAQRMTKPKRRKYISSTFQRWHASVAWPSSSRSWSAMASNT